MKYVANIVRAVEAVEAYRRIPDKLKHLTFFSHDDWWIYHAVLDGRTCPQCEAYAKGVEAQFSGEFLRSMFPYLEIVDEDTIMANVHPNCRCWLERAKE